ncbi:MAG: hypothetical protein J6T68_02000 [Candidatus Methanomethylophilaceae archaeon]|nr:hypothetical protein [Candidatus Methanomethylophilaceae archaeon]
MLTTVLFVHLNRIGIVNWSSDSISDSKLISSRTSVRKNVRLWFNDFSERYTVDTGYSMFEADAVAITDRWMYEIGDTVILPDFDVEIYGPATKLRVEQDTDRLGLYHLTDPQRSLIMKMIGQSVPFRPNPES